MVQKKAPAKKSVKKKWQPDVWGTSPNKRGTLSKKQRAQMNEKHVVKTRGGGYHGSTEIDSVTEKHGTYTTVFQTYRLNRR